MDGALAVLAEEHLVQVGLEDLALVVVQLQQHRHHGLGGLARDAALVGQIEVLHQLLGQGTAALAQLAGRGIDPEGTDDRLGRYAEMVEELAILHRHQGFDQVGRHLVQVDQHAVFVVRGVEAADQQRLQPRHGQVGAVGLGQAGHVVAGEAHANPLRRFGAFVELEATGVQFNAVAGDRCGTRAVGQALAAIAQGIEFLEEVILAQLQADEQFQRPGIDLGRHRPALAGEFLLHHGIEVDGETSQHDQAHQAELDGPAKPWTEAAGAAFRAGFGGSRTGHGGALYALYPQPTGAP
ncbi:hypothetical protein D3C80_1005740 [compost metagenome]